MNSPFTGPRPEYLDEIRHWPEGVRAVLELKARAWAKAAGIPLAEAEFLAWCRLMRGLYRLPPVEVDAMDGAVPRWADRLPTAVTVVYS